MEEELLRSYGRLKEAVMRSATLRFLDYALPPFRRCNAFTVACGSTLLLAGEAVEGKHVLLKMIAFISKKFSGVAQRWDI